MTNFILSNINSIRKKHYVLKASSSDYWVEFYESVLNHYKSQFGEDFNLIIYGNANIPNDFVSVPYVQLKELLTDEHIDQRKRRWVFSIENNKLRVHRNVRRIDIEKFRGNKIDIPELYQYGTIQELSELNQNKEEHFRQETERLSVEELTNKIQSLDRSATYKQGTTKYYQRRAIVAEYAKRRANGMCQLCQENAPFVNSRRKPYLEAHHIVWLSRGGDDIPENTAALCPNCHRKMHILNLTPDRETILSRIQS